MQQRMDISSVLPAGFKAMKELQAFLDNCGLDHTLAELIKIRASQINGCAFCLNMHTADARKHGETEKRLYNLAAWQEAPFYTEKERAALALTEAVTLLSVTRVPDDVYNAAAAVFSQEELAKVIMAIVVINSWNRIVVTTRLIPE
ncbi:carboxymuconolactone decarboxylase family protein [Chitinophaga nivalis]|uniref:Carboxymuconolactone decarboxylase family protein n=1 Tax=Chitinophaga nivalis TaxID=2991709 RepID=A0ABT3IQ38_9BACT|nr:carboxymuconolactone decarboxylase family protein [Chitinophaga nivalis]MCW3464450.1 carboxymuconolactone decarboxylase family protein [Chitinophaga nivalis]MCW3485859.1 carboxymuconolactone decarboxylase family protein [Chitinophaga nivalis]